MPQLGDTVELIIDIPEHTLRAGMRGAVAHLHSQDAYGIEFINTEGETLDFVILKPDQFIVVWRNATHDWVPITEQTAALVAIMPIDAAREVLDFARFLAVRAQLRMPESSVHTLTEQPIPA